MLATCFFAFLYAFWSMFFGSILQYKRYIGFTDEKKAYWISTLVGNCHHMIVVCYTYYIFLHPDCPGETYPLAFFYEDKCFYQVDPRFAQAGCLTCGYMSYDLVIQYMFIQDHTPLGLQTWYHHIIGVVGIFLGVQGGYACPGISNIALSIELSTIFMNFRTMYDKKDFGNFGPQVL